MQFFGYKTRPYFEKMVEGGKDKLKIEQVLFKVETSFLRKKIIEIR